MLQIEEKHVLDYFLILTDLLGKTKTAQDVSCTNIYSKLQI